MSNSSTSSRGFLSGFEFSDWPSPLVSRLEALSSRDEHLADVIVDGILTVTFASPSKFVRSFCYEVTGEFDTLLSVVKSAQDVRTFCIECLEQIALNTRKAQAQRDQRDALRSSQFETLRLRGLREQSQINQVMRSALPELISERLAAKKPKVKFSPRAVFEPYLAPVCEVEDFSIEFAKAGFSDAPTVVPREPPRRSIARERKSREVSRLVTRLFAPYKKVPEVAVSAKPVRAKLPSTPVLKLTGKQIWARDIQVGISSPADKPSRRFEREAQHRASAKERVKSKYKRAYSKEDRASHVRSQRDKRVPQFELQGGKVLLAAALCGGATVVGAAVKGIGRIAGEVSKLAKLGSAVSSDLRKRMGGVVDILEDFIKGFKKVVGSVLWVIPAALVFYFIFSKFSLPSPATLAIFASVGGVLFGKSLWSHISKFFRCGDEDPDTIHLQSGGSGVMAKLLASVACFSVFGAGYKPHLVGEFCKRISMLERCASGWEAFISWTVAATEVVVNFVRARFSLPAVKLQEEKNSLVKEWCRDVDAMVCSDSTATQTASPSVINDMVKLVKRGYDLKELYRDNEPMRRSIGTQLIAITTVLAPHLGSISARNNFRFEPAMVCLLGDPGIGKTMMAVPFCAHILLRSGLMSSTSTPDEVLQQIWQKGSSDYWNGYDGQLVNVMDDIFQQRADGTDKESEYMALIRAIGTWSFPLNMADVTSKGKYYYLSKLVFATTNVKSIRSEAAKVLNEPAAVSRRITFPYRITLVDSYKDTHGRLDMAKYQSAYETSPSFPWHIWKVNRHDFMTGESVGPEMPLAHLLDEIVAGVKQRIASFDNNRDAIHKYIKGLAIPSEGEIQLQSGFNAVNLSLVPATCVKILQMADEETRDFIRANRIAAKWLARAVLGIGLVIGVKVLVGLAKALFGGLKLACGGVGAVARRRKKVVTQSNVPRIRVARKVNPNSPVLQSGDSTIVTNVYSNTYKMTVDTAAGQTYCFGQVCFLMSSLMTCPQHFADDIERQLWNGNITRDSELMFTNAAHTRFSFKVSVARFLACKRVTRKSMDVDFVDLSTLQLRSHRNIVGSFISEQSLRYVSGSEARLDVCDITPGRFGDVWQRKVYSLAAATYGSSLRWDNRQLDRYFCYRAATEFGDCGAPISLVDNTSYKGQTVLGFHTAYQPARGTGYSSVVTQEMIAEAVRELSILQDNFSDDLARRGVVLQSGDLKPFADMGSFLPIGTVDKPVGLCPKTSYFVNKGFYGAFGEYDYFPAPLSPVFREGECVYPMVNATAPYKTPLYIVDVDKHKQAAHVAFSQHYDLTRNDSRIIYDFEEAVLGVPQHKFRSLPRSTAPGFPYCYDFKDGKRSFFGEGADYDLSGPLALELKERVAYIVSEAKLGKRCGHVFVDFLKDELRSRAKVEAVKTRLISSAPMDYSIAFRMYFGAFTATSMRKHTLSGMAPGICSYSDTDLLARMLTRRGEKVFDGDYTAFDSTELPSVMVHILDYINKWYDDGPENALIRRVLWEDLCHSRHIGGNGLDQRHVYQWNKSLPSGHPFTTMCNSMYSLLTIVACYIKLTGDMTGFWENASAVTYGDDNVVNVSDAIADAFNQVTISDAMLQEFHLVYTSSKKDGLLEPYTTLDDVSFLKRKLVFDSGYWLCPLELDSFLYTVYWCKNRRLRKKITRDVLETALEELSIHDSSVWNLYAQQIGKMLDEMGAVSRCPIDQSIYRRLVLARTDAWY